MYKCSTIVTTGKTRASGEVFLWVDILAIKILCSNFTTI